MRRYFLTLGLLAAMTVTGGGQTTDGGKRPKALNESTNYLPKWSPDGSRIVFCSTAAGNWEIYSVNVDGSQLTRLTNHPALDFGPSWSPDGSRILFVSDRDGNREIYVMGVKDSRLTRLTNSAAADINPSFSPDGSKIVFVSDREGAREIYVMNADGTSPVRLTDGSSVNGHTRPTYSPDGRKIAFYSTKSGKDGDRRMLYVMDADGANVKPVSGAGYDGNQAWSPDGSKLAFDAPATGKDSSANGEWEIYSVNADGSGRTRLTNNTSNDWGPAWSPDGSKIVYCSGWNNQYEIYVMNSDGSKAVRVTRIVYPSARR